MTCWQKLCFCFGPKTACHKLLFRGPQDVSDAVSAKHLLLYASMLPLASCYHLLIICLNSKAGRVSSRYTHGRQKQLQTAVRLAKSKTELALTILWCNDVCFQDTLILVIHSLACLSRSCSCQCSDAIYKRLVLNVIITSISA